MLGFFIKILEIKILNYKMLNILMSFYKKLFITVYEIFYLTNEDGVHLNFFELYLGLLVKERSFSGSFPHTFFVSLSKFIFPFSTK